MGLKKKVQYPEMSANEKKLQEKASTGTVEEVKDLLQEEDVKVDCLDESGMTPLQQAAFRNKIDIAELLLSHGADVNSNMHENDYTALMFAALSGNTEMTRLMLKNGAKKDKINSVNRNAAQMAAFVGQHQCVAVINNYYDESDLEYFTKIQGQEKEPKLPPMVMPALLKLLNMSNIHPVKVSYHLQEREGLMKDSYKVCKVLDIICENAMKSKDTDDIMALKAHYLATVIRKAKERDNLDMWFKWLMKGRAQDGYPEQQDQLIRQSLKEFPYPESQLLLNMVRQLSQTKIGENPTSYNILMQGINGQKFAFDEETVCETCGEMKAKKCVKCKMAGYCDAKCQKLHWPTHKKLCASLAEDYKRIQEQKKKEEELAEQEKLKQERKVAELKKLDADSTQSNSEGKAATNDGSKPKVTESTKSSNGDKQVASNVMTEGDKTKEEDENIPDIETILSDPAIRKAFQDEDIEKAIKEIKEDPLKIENYKENKQIQDLIERITSKIPLNKKDDKTPEEKAKEAAK